jgi:hypothetical protein
LKKTDFITDGDENRAKIDYTLTFDGRNNSEIERHRRVFECVVSNKGELAISDSTVGERICTESTILVSASSAEMFGQRADT